MYSYKRIVLLYVVLTYTNSNVFYLTVSQCFSFSTLPRCSSSLWFWLLHWKQQTPRSVGAQYATGDQWRNNSRKNEGMEPKEKQYPVMDVTGDRSKVRCCNEQYYIETWNVRPMNQGKLEVVKQEMARVNVDILGISD